MAGKMVRLSKPANPNNPMEILRAYEEVRHEFHKTALKWYQKMGRGVLAHGFDERGVVYVGKQLMKELNDASPVQDDQIIPMIDSYNPAREFVVFIVVEGVALSAVIKVERLQ